MTQPATLDALLGYIKHQGRVCPVPTRWHELFEMLPDRVHTATTREPPLPLILSGWHYSSNLEKMVRLALHVRWADAHGALARIDSFLRGLPETEWHHLGE